MKHSNSVFKSFRQSNPAHSKKYNRLDFEFLYCTGKDWWDNEPVGFKVSPKSSINKSSHDANVGSFLTVNILDNQIVVSSKLIDIVNEINDSKTLIDLEYNWGHNEELPLDPELYLNTVQFLLQYSEFVLKAYHIVIETPEINLCPNGSLDLSWVTKSARLLINTMIKDGKIVRMFYGYTKLNLEDRVQKIEKEGFIDSLTFDESFAVWMKSLG